MGKHYNHMEGLAFLPVAHPPRKNKHEACTELDLSLILRMTKKQ